MSGASYTLTPNLGLYKPVPNADTDAWGGHLNSNADTLDGILGTTFGIAGSGAVGDGVTDDQPAIQPWLNSLSARGGGEVTLAPGKWYYVHAASLVIPPNVVIRGAYSARDNQAAGGAFFGAGGFVIDPTLPAGIVMQGTSGLRNVKIYRSGLVANANNTVATAAYAAWTAEGVYQPLSAAVAANATVIPLANTTGITVGMQVTGANGGFAPPQSGVWTPPTVVSIVANTSVTISPGSTPALAAGYWLRFGASIGIQIAANAGGVEIDSLMIIGFRTGIQVYPGQFQITRMNIDCITCFEGAGGGDWSSTRDCEFLPLYGMQPGTNFVRAGEAVFIHDNGGFTFTNIMSIGWQVGWHVENCAGLTLNNCFDETLGNAGPGLVNYYFHGGAGAYVNNCHAQGGGIGFHIDGLNQFYMTGCTSAGSQATTANNIAHWLIENTSGGQMYGTVASPQTYGGWPSKVPFKYGTGTVNEIALINPSIQDLTALPTAPYVVGTIPNSFALDLVAPNYSGGLANAGTVNMVAYRKSLVLDAGANPLGSQTLVLPPYPSDGQQHMVRYNVGVTALTVSTTDGSAVGNYPANVPAGSAQQWIYSAAQNKWFVGAGGGNYLLTTGGTMTGPASFSSTGINFANNLGASSIDLTKHIELYATQYGIAVTGNRMNMVMPGGASMILVNQSNSADGASINAGTGAMALGPTSGNRVTVTPGVATTNAIVVTQSGTGGVQINPTIGFNGTAPIAKPTISGACAGNTAIKALLTALASYGLLTDSTTA